MMAWIYLLAALVAITPLSKPGPRPVEVGPIHLGEAVRDIISTLGHGWRGLDCRKTFSRDRCYDILVYTDGRDQLKLQISGSNKDDESVDLIEARQGRAMGGAIRPGVAAIAHWRWSGGRLFDMPRSVAGWETHWSTSGADYRYDHPLAVWISRNPWRGRDFHMFEE